MLVFVTIDHVSSFAISNTLLFLVPPHCLLFVRVTHVSLHAFPVNIHMVSVPHLPQRHHVIQAKQYIILSITVSHRNHDIDPEYLIAVLSVMVRYATGVFSDTMDAVTQGSPTRLWAAVSLERGFTNNRLHVQGAGLVRSCVPSLLCCLHSSCCIFSYMLY
jgi:hypothetical protein